MSGHFDVVPEALTQASRAFFGLSDEVAAAVGTLTGALEDTGGMAGGDRPGTAFARFYDPQARALEGSLGQLGGVLAGIADGLAAMAHNYGVADVRVTLRVGRESP